MRRAAKIDNNQSEIVSVLRSIPGLSVEVGHDDILVGHAGKTYWFEIKAESAISKKTGEVKWSEVTESERKRLATWHGHYQIVWNIRQILEAIGIA